jgi:DNA-binding transcriptional LysR family regulator
MKNLPMELLRTFVVVSQLDGFTQAGDLLGRSQPAISLQIKRLEGLVGQTLLIRSGPNLELTQVGQTLFDYARRILALNDEALGKLDSAAISGKIRLGIPSEFATTLLPKIVSRFVRTHPNVTLEVNCDLSKNLLSRSGKRKHDLILALHDNPREAGHNRVRTDELVWVTSAEHKAHLQTTVQLIAALDGCIYRNRAIKKLDEYGQPWQIVYTIPDLSGIQAAIEEGLGVTVLAKSTVPSSLKVLKSSDTLPKLGKIGISLITPNEEKNEAVLRISEYLKASLT